MERKEGKVMLMERNWPVTRERGKEGRETDEKEDGRKEERKREMICLFRLSVEEGRRE